ncbi:MAG: glycosyltransferase [Fimbriimonadaceae bacterium]|nr:glycosyltransferase [Fimbriimonadaceae bacterium]
MADLEVGSCPLAGQGGGVLNLLVVTFSYSPALSPRAFRWTSLAEAWAAEGHQVDVVCSAVQGLPTEEALNGVCVHRVGGGLRQKLTQTASQGPTSVGQPATPAGPIIVAAKAARALYRVAVKPFQWPDYAASWRRLAAHTAKEIVHQRGVDRIVAVSHPFSSLLAGSEVAAETSIPWLADVGDPFSFDDQVPLNNRALFGARNRKTEREVLGRAKAVAVTNDLVRQEYARLFPELAEKLAVIGPLASDLAASENAEPLFSEEEGKCKLLFTGTVYRDIRSLNPVLAVFKRLVESTSRCEYEIHFAGRLQGCSRCLEPVQDWIGTKVFVHGLVSRERIAATIPGCSALVNIGNSTPYQLPSKVAEYAVSGKPILNFHTLDDDSSKCFLKPHPGVCNVLCAEGFSPDQRASEIEAFFAAMAQSPPRPCEEWLDTFRLPHLKARYEELLR